MIEYKKNPRKISKFELDRLEKNIAEFGDLSGVTVDLDTKEIITGNQRVKALKLENCEIVLTEEEHDPDAQGTVAIGYIVAPDGTKLNYRAVRWSDEQREKANITANKLGGQWDWEILNNPELWQRETLVDAGFDWLDFDQEKVDVNDNTETSAKTKATRFFTLEVLFPNKDDYVTVTEIIDKSKKPDETIAETLKRLLVSVVDGEQSDKK